MKGTVVYGTVTKASATITKAKGRGLPEGGTKDKGTEEGGII